MNHSPTLPPPSTLDDNDPAESATSPTDADPGADDADPNVDDDHNQDSDGAAGGDNTERRRSSRGAQSQAALRRVARKAIQLTTADRSTTSILADLHGISDTADLAVSIVTGGRNQLAPLRELLNLDTSDPIELGVELGALGRAKMRTLWRLLTAVDAASGDLHASDVKAAVQAARAVTDLSPQQRKQLEAAASLGSRS